MRHVINNHVNLEYFSHVTYSVVKVKWNGIWDDESEIYPTVLALTAHMLNSNLSFLQWLTLWKYKKLSSSFRKLQ